MFPFSSSFSPGSKPGHVAYISSSLDTVCSSNRKPATLGGCYTAPMKNHTNKQGTKPRPFTREDFQKLLQRAVQTPAQKPSLKSK
jgi:hypothetical protein